MPRIECIKNNITKTMVIIITIATWRQRLTRPEKTVNKENAEKLRISRDISEYSKLSQKDYKCKKTTNSEQKSIGRFAENIEN